MKRFAWVIAVASVVFLAVAAAIVRSKANALVVGVREADLFADQKLLRSKSTLAAGTRLSVLTKLSECLEVGVPTGAPGWVRRCVACSVSEFNRRKRAGEIPERFICIGSHKGGGLFMYGGAMSIGDGEMRAEPGQAFWMDPSAEGEQLTIGSTAVKGDPNVLLLVKQDGRLAKLPISPPL